MQGDNRPSAALSQPRPRLAQSSLLSPQHLQHRHAGLWKEHWAESPEAWPLVLAGPLVQALIGLQLVHL